MKLYFGPGSEIWKQFLLEHYIPEYRILGENTIIADDWDHLDDMIKQYVIGAGTGALMTSYLNPLELSFGDNEKINKGRGWYRSEENPMPGDHLAGWLTNKKWHLNEVKTKSAYTDMRLQQILFKEMARHLLYFQQVIKI